MTSRHFDVVRMATVLVLEAVGANLEAVLWSYGKINNIVRKNQSCTYLPISLTDCGMCYNISYPQIYQRNEANVSPAPQHTVLIVLNV